MWVSCHTIVLCNITLQKPMKALSWKTKTGIPDCVAALPVFSAFSQQAANSSHSFPTGLEAAGKGHIQPWFCHLHPNALHDSSTQWFAAPQCFFFFCGRGKPSAPQQTGPTCAQVCTPQIHQARLVLVLLWKNLNRLLTLTLLFFLMSSSDLFLLLGPMAAQVRTGEKVVTEINQQGALQSNYQHKKADVTTWHFIHQDTFESEEWERLCPKNI